MAILNAIKFIRKFKKTSLAVDMKLLSIAISTDNPFSIAFMTAFSYLDARLKKRLLITTTPYV